MTKASTFLPCAVYRTKKEFIVRRHSDAPEGGAKTYRSNVKRKNNLRKLLVHKLSERLVLFAHPEGAT